MCEKINTHSCLLSCGIECVLRTCGADDDSHECVNISEHVWGLYRFSNSDIIVCWGRELRNIRVWADLCVVT